VYVNFTGPLKTGKVALSSEPALAQQQIVELITSGSAEGAQATNPSVDPTSTAVSSSPPELRAPAQTRARAQNPFFSNHASATSATSGQPLSMLRE